MVFVYWVRSLDMNNFNYHIKYNDLNDLTMDASLITQFQLILYRFNNQKSHEVIQSVCYKLLLNS